jgi:hypothetical protein
MNSITIQERRKAKNNTYQLELKRNSTFMSQVIRSYAIKRISSPSGFALLVSFQFFPAFWAKYWSMIVGFERHFT